MSAPPLLVVCEDGTEYRDRFERFLGGEFRFAPAQDLAAARAACADAAALLLDLDFRRVPPGRLVGEDGRPLAPGTAAAEARRLAEVQGILILRALRAEGVALPALLFADLDDPDRAAGLERTLAPLAVLPSLEGLGAIAARLRALVRARPP